jgi:hypothetical protein
MRSPCPSLATNPGDGALLGFATPPAFCTDKRWNCSTCSVFGYGFFVEFMWFAMAFVR